MKLSKVILVYLALFFLFYFESQQIGPITFSQLWKIPLFVFLFWKALVIRKKQKPEFIKWSYARAAKNLITGRLSASFTPGITDFLRYMMFPLMYQYAANKFKSISALNKILLGFSQFVIISGIPFILGILKTKGLESVNLLEDEYIDSYTGVFQNAHGSSITTAISILILLAFLKSKSTIIRFRKLNYFLLIFGIYLLFLTYVRTGYVMFAVGFLILYLPQKFSLRQIVGGLVVISLLFTGFFYLLQTNEFFYNRIFDIRNGRETAVGSGRLVLWSTSWDLWLIGDFSEKLFGFGYNSLLEYNYKITGQRIYAHNEVFTQLAQNGLLGVLFFIGYLVGLFRFIWKRRKQPSYRLSIAIFALYVSLMMTQGGVWFQLDIFMVLVFVKLQFEYLMSKEYKFLELKKNQDTPKIY